MPLLFVVIGKRKLGSNSYPSEYNKDGPDRSKGSNFNRMIDLDEIHLDENVKQPESDAQLSRSDQNAFDDNVRLVNDRETGVIKITEQIMQTHEPRDLSSPLQENSHVIPSSWTRRSLLAPVNQSDLKVSESLGMAIPTPWSLVSRFSRPSAVNECDTVIIFLWTGLGSYTDPIRSDTSARTLILFVQVYQHLSARICISTKILYQHCRLNLGSYLHA